MSSLGKGLAAASIGALLEGHGYKVALQKFDPYINVDPGTMSPYQHGEVYVTDDGAETDLDLGHYERFTNQVDDAQQQLDDRQDLPVGDPEGAAAATTSAAPSRSSRTSPTRSRTASARSRTTWTSSSSRSAAPSATSRACRSSRAIRQLRQDVGRENTLYIHLTLVPFIGAAGELKTKPTQHSVRDLRAIGIQPDILLCRTDRFLDQDIKRKIALFCDVDEEAVITAKDVSSIYEVPLVLAAEGLDRIVLQRLQPAADRSADGRLGRPRRPHQESRRTRSRSTSSAKYVGYEDSYKSLNEALYHGGFKHRLRVNIRWVEAEALEQPGGEQLLDGADGILVPGGFGDRGTRGMMRAAEIARERGIPYFGICYGFQWAAVEYARHVCGLADADSTECAPDTPHNVIYKLRDLLGVDDLGGTMRLGSYAVRAEAGLARPQLYGEPVIHERHRHRYEFNCLYEKTLTERAWRSSAARSTASSSRSSSCPSIRGTSRCSSTRSSSRSRSSRTRCLPASSRRATVTRHRPERGRSSGRRAVGW